MSSQLFRRKPVAALTREVEGRLHTSLGVRDLTVLGIAAILGAGMFSAIGSASADGGPAVVLLYVFTALASLLAALCYAEFASAIPLAGSAYTYAYASFGELLAWIIGWDLVVEYAVGNIAVAISWSGYFTTFLGDLGWEIAPHWTMDFRSAGLAYESVMELLNGAATELRQVFLAAPTVEHLRAIAPNADVVTKDLVEGYRAWTEAPQVGGLRLIADLPAIAIVVLITLIVLVGIRESKRASNLLVAVKLLVVFAVIVLGALYVDPKNWSPFAPNGFAGVMKGVGAVFFAYIGFDALSTLSEESKNPQRDLPRAMFWTLGIVTGIYVLVALVLTGLAPASVLNVEDPLALAIEYTGLPPAARQWALGIVAGGAIIATTTVLLVFQLGQPRILFAMARDGLLPQKFARIHRRFRTPDFATWVTGIFVALPLLFVNLEDMLDLTSIGTLFAFVLVCGGVLLLQHRPPEDYRPLFSVPYVNSRYIIPGLFLAFFAWVVLALIEPAYWPAVRDFIALYELNPATGEPLPVSTVFFLRIPYLLFIAVFAGMAWASWRHRLSLLPSLGLLTCFYLMAEINLASWVRFLAWLAVGMVIYFAWGRRHSRLNATR